MDFQGTGFAEPIPEFPKKWLTLYIKLKFSNT
jgi:hypothetical protein